MQTNLSVEDLLSERDWLERVAYRLVQDRGEAQDVAQETLLAALESPPPADRPVRGWLARVATNVVRMRYRSDTRRQRREGAIAAPAVETTGESFSQAHREQVSQLLAEALCRLDEPYRAAILYRFCDELTIREIAARQGVPEGTASWRLSEGLKRLRSDLDRRAGGDARPWLLALTPGSGLSETATAPAAATHGGMTMTKLLFAVFAAAALGGTSLLIHQRSSGAEATPPPAARAAAADEQPTKVNGTPGHSPTPVPAAPTGGDPAGAAPPSFATARPGAATPLAPQGFSYTFRAPDDPDAGVPVSLLRDLGEMTPVLNECFEDLFRREPALRERGAAATLRLRFVQDAELGPVVVDSQQVPGFGLSEDASFVECTRESAFAWEFSQPFGAAGDEFVVDVGISYDPVSARRARGGAKRCIEELEERRPEALEGEAITDPIYGRCMDRAMGIETSAQTQTMRSCWDQASQLASASPERREEAYAECLGAAGFMVIGSDVVVDSRAERSDSGDAPSH